MSKLIYAFVPALATLCYLVAEKSYNKGTKDSARKIMEYAKAHPDQTFEQFLKKMEEEA